MTSPNEKPQATKPEDFSMTVQVTKRDNLMIVPTQYGVRMRVRSRVGGDIDLYLDYTDAAQLAGGLERAVEFHEGKKGAPRSPVEKAKA